MVNWKGNQRERYQRRYTITSRTLKTWMFFYSPEPMVTSRSALIDNLGRAVVLLQEL
jgi:hypothetical protein